MNKLIYINTQEWIRLKFFQIIIFIAFVFVCFSYLLGSLSFTEQQRLVIDFGLAGIELALIFIAAFFSTHSLHRDIDRKTILVLLARPIQRWKIIIGYFGSLAVLNLITTVALGLTLGSFLKESRHIVMFIVALFFIYIKSLIIGAFGLFASVVARPMFAFVLSLTYWLVSYSVEDIKFFLKKSQADNSVLNTLLDNFFPQFYKYNWKTFGFVKTLPNIGDLSWASVHSLFWLLLFLMFSMIIFRRKEIV